MYDYNCGRCGGLVPEPMKAYGYAGSFCHCAEPLRPQAGSFKIITTRTDTPMNQDNRGEEKMMSPEQIDKAIFDNWNTPTDNRGEELTNNGQPHVCGTIQLNNVTKDKPISLCAKCHMPVDTPTETEHTKEMSKSFWLGYEQGVLYQQDYENLHPEHQDDIEAIAKAKGINLE